MVHADHSAGDQTAGGDPAIYLGEAVGFIIELADGTRIYHAGDTAVFGDMRLIGELFRPEVAFLPIGGHFTMDPPAAARAVELLGTTTVVPIHYATFGILAGTPEQLREELARLGLDDVRVLVPERGSPVE
jgi:L-ascorbate metabolism protein UlaG (beta-lactamase superfamily)